MYAILYGLDFLTQILKKKKLPLETRYSIPGCASGIHFQKEMLIYYNQELIYQAHIIASEC